MGRCELEWKGPGAVGDHKPGETWSSWCSCFASDPSAGDDGREGYGEPDGKGELVLANGERVKRYILGSSCQKVLRLTNMRVQPSGDDSSCAHPTVESSLAMSPMRSNLGSTTLPLNTPSLLMFMRHSPFGFPASAVFLEIAFVTCSVGSGW